MLIVQIQGRIDTSMWTFILIDCEASMYIDSPWPSYILILTIFLKMQQPHIVSVL